ncbi:hypothetical protein QP938_09180 [Porticoccaceae bacterium LTM1]|nr:hypothetical protein QP938_09180 [Porticoccaceae bacterium LTM1]
MREFLIAVCFVSISGCGFYPNEYEVIGRVSEVIEIPIPNDFEIINSSSSFSPGDMIQEFEIEFSASAYEELLKRINLSEWIKCESGYQYIRDLSEKSEAHVSIGSECCRLRYQYGEI